MTERKSIDALFNKNAKYTKEEFKAKYLELREAELKNADSMSVFASDLDVSIDNIFDTLNTNNNKTLDESEIETLQEFFNDDNNESVSEGDLDKLYKNTIARLKKMPVDTTNPETITNRRVAIESLITARTLSSQTKIQSLQNELDYLINFESNLASKEKKAYQKNSEKIQKYKIEKQKQETELKSAQEEMKHAQLEIEYIKEHKKISEKSDAEIKDWTDKYNKFEKKYGKIQNAINDIDRKITELTSNNQQLVDKAISNKANFEQKKKYLSNLIKTETADCQRDINGYKSEVTELETVEQKSYKAATVACPQDYYDEDTSNFNYDAQVLKSKWAKSKPYLSDGFYSEVVAISEKVGCDPNALMAVMDAESKILPHEENDATHAIGLIQFMPRTAKELGTSNEKLRNMSAEEQLIYVEKYLMNAKKMAKIGKNEKVDSGTLYALVFMPSKAKQNIFATAGTKAYKLNENLDKKNDNDGKITKADLAAKVKSRMK